MSKMNSLLSQRLKAPLEKLSKMTNLAELSSAGHLSSFAGVFKVSSPYMPLHLKSKPSTIRQPSYMERGSKERKRSLKNMKRGLLPSG